MFDKNKYLFIIEHDKDDKENIECSELKAFKIDDKKRDNDKDGIAKNIGFKSNIINKVDDFLEKDHRIQLIELSDLRENIKECNANIKEQLEKIEQETVKSTFKTKKRKEIQKEAWKNLKSEFCQKWSGSIAVIERLYRKTGEFDNDPKYSLLIVCKNETDIRMLDSFVNQLNGMMGEAENVKVCTTEKLDSFIILRI